MGERFPACSYLQCARCSLGEPILLTRLLLFQLLSASFDGFLLKAEVTSTWSLDSEARNNNTKERRSPLSFLLLLHLSMIRRVIGARFLAVLIVSLQRETKSTS